VLGLLVFLPSAAGASLPDAPTAEREFLTLLNRTRASSGRSPLLLDPAASNVSRSWAGTMAREGRLYHNPNLASHVSSFVTSDWRRAGENVGVGGGIQTLHDAFWASAPHRANMLGDYNRVGVGVVVAERIWVTFTFVNSPSMPAGLPGCRAPGYLLDGYGGLHPVGGALRLRTTGYWRGWDIARDASLTPDGTKGYVLDGFGGLHPVGSATRIQTTGYWRGWDIARGVAVTPDGRGAYVMDAYGGIHHAGAARRVRPTGYWRGWKIARDIEVDPTHGSRGYVLDGLGGLHPFGGMPKARLGRYFGRDVARSFVLLADGTGGYVLDLWGGVFPFAVGDNPMPPMIGRTPVFGGPRAEALLLGDQPAVVTGGGAEIGAGATPCGAQPRWQWSILRAAVGRSL